MKRTTYCIMAAALLTAGALLTTACSSEDAAIENATPTVGSETTQFTATLAPKDGTTTRAITPETDANNKEILNVAWTAGEQVAVYYQKTDDSYGKATAIVGELNSDKSAPITATLSDAKNGGTVKFVYPASLVNATGDDIDAEKLRNNQVGTIADISANFDAATGSGTLVTDGTTCGLSSTVTMTNRVCICKFHFSYKYANGTALTLESFHGLKIYTVDGAYTVSTTTTGDIYVAMLPCTGANITFLADASFGDGMTGSRNFFTAYPTGVTLAAGKFYRNLPIALTYNDKVKDLSKGSITATNGYLILQGNKAATTNTITIADGATVTLDGVNISTTSSSGIICNGTASIVLKGTNSVTTTSEGYAAIQAGGTGTLTISGSGSLMATGGNGSAGIGSNRASTCGNITISGGTINATGGSGAAGIGSGRLLTGTQGQCGNITITGGIVNATGGTSGSSHGGAGIGSGMGGKCGNITISGGSVTATKGVEGAYSIGKGTGSSFCGTVTIDGTQYYDGTNFQNGGDTYLATSPFTWPTL